MGTRGPAPRPAKLKLIDGVSPGRDSGGRRVPLPPRFIRQAPEPPPDLDSVEREEWDRVVSEHERLGLLKQADHSALVIHCQTWGRYLRACAQFRKEGLTLTNPQSGRAHKNPAVTIAETAAHQFFASCREFGITPSAEQRLGELTSDGTDEDNPFAWAGRRN